MSPRRISRRAFGAAAACAAAALGVPALRAQQARPEKPRLSIAVNSRAALGVLPLTVAEQLGYFSHEGLEVEIAEQPSGTRPLDDGLIGAADIVSGSFDHVVLLQGRGQAFQAFVVQARAPQVALGVSTRAVPAWRGLADLRGRRIGISAQGSVSNLVANLVLARGGIKPAEVAMVGVGAAHGAMMALRAGQVDAVSTIDPAMTFLEQRGEVRVVGDSRTLRGAHELFGGTMPGGCLYAPAEFVQRHPLTCQAVSNAVVHALKWLQTAGPSDIIKAVPESYFNGDRALYLASFNKVRESISPDGVFPDDGVRTAVRAIAGFDPAFRPEAVQAARVYTNEFARRSKDKFHA